MHFDITGQKAYVSDGPYRNQLGIVKRDGTEKNSIYKIVINNVDIDVELKDIILVDVDVRQFHDWCERNGYS